MFNLVKLALLGFFFYLLYDFSTGLLAKRAQTAAAAARAAVPVRHRDLNLTGSTGEGIVEQVVGAGGSRRRTKVGRGVI